MWTARTKGCSLVAWVVLMAFAAFAWSAAAGASAGHPLAQKSAACPAPFHATPSCRTATRESAERMLRHPVTLKSEACPAPFDAKTSCGFATVPADWARPDGRPLEN
jgi:hypothetical protein